VYIAYIVDQTTKPGGRAYAKESASFWYVDGDKRLRSPVKGKCDIWHLAFPPASFLQLVSVHPEIALFWMEVSDVSCYQVKGIPKVIFDIRSKDRTKFALHADVPLSE
jgi:hypothetical protein